MKVGSRDNFAFLITRVVQRRLSFLLQVRMLPCLLWVSMRRNTNPILILYPMLVALPTVLLHWQRFLVFSVPITFSIQSFSCDESLKWLSNVHFQVIHDKFGIVEGLMTTVHSITGVFPT